PRGGAPPVPRRRSPAGVPRAAGPGPEGWGGGGPPSAGDRQSPGGGTDCPGAGNLRGESSPGPGGGAVSPVFDGPGGRRGAGCPRGSPGRADDRAPGPLSKPPEFGGTGPGPDSVPVLSGKDPDGDRSPSGNDPGAG